MTVKSNHLVNPKLITPTRNMLTELKEVISVEVEGKGSGRAFMVIDYGPDYELQWVVFIDLSGEMLQVNTSKVRIKTKLPNTNDFMS